jgi:predicted short-subunit dehydrogenase-like oxidoreductase (DUF2520 family)
MLNVESTLMPKRQLTLTIVGAGRVGRTLGRTLRQRGWRIGAVITRSAKTAAAAVRAIGAGRAESSLDASVLFADVVLIATPDRAIAAVVNNLARFAVAQGTRWFAGGALRVRPHQRTMALRGKIVLHTNGALDRSVLAPLEKLGAATGSLHPLQTFTQRKVPNLDGCICAIEGTPAALRAARRIARDLGCVPVVLAPKSKPAYHAAAALAAGHTLAVTEAATRILIAVGFTRREAVRALLPLTRETLANFERFGPSAAWTGPLARRDFATAKKHAVALRRFPREYRDAYAALSRLALRVLG